MYVEVSDCDKKLFWKLINNYVVEEGKEHGEIGLRRFYFDFFKKEEEGVV